MNTPINVSVKEAAYRLGVGRTFVYERLDSGEIASLKCGKRRLVPLAALEAYQRACLVRSAEAKAA